MTEPRRLFTHRVTVTETITYEADIVATSTPEAITIVGDMIRRRRGTTPQFTTVDLTYKLPDNRDASATIHIEQTITDSVGHRGAPVQP